MNVKDTQALFSSVIQYFKENYTLSDSGKDSFKINTRTHTARQFVDKFKKEIDAIAKFAGRGEFYSIVDTLQKSKNWTEDQAIESMADQVFSHFKKQLSTASRERVTKVSGSELMAHSFQWDNHIPIMDIKTKRHCMYNTRINSVDHNVSYASWLDAVKMKPSEDRKILLNTSISAVVDYDPYRVEEIDFKSVSGQDDVLHVNAHRLPDWRKIERNIDTPPKMFEELMFNLFPRVECREYVLHWMNFMMTSRNHCYLVLHGEQGVGKNSLYYIMQQLVGMENSIYIEPSYWDSRFNSELKFKRLAFFDETIINHENVTKIRAMTNKYVTIEEKGLDPMQTENHCSFVLASNLDKKNLITYDDRRFSVPILGDKNLKDVLGQEWLDVFYDRIYTDKEFIADIGWYILNHGDKGKYNEKQPYITDAFYDMVDKALANWQRNIIELIEKRLTDIIYLSDIKDELQGTGRTKLTIFLNTHKDREGNSYGIVWQDPKGKRCIKVDKAYWPEDMLQDDSEDLDFL